MRVQTPTESGNFEAGKGRLIKVSIKISPVRDWRSTSLEWLSSTRDLDLDLVSDHTAYHRAPVIDLYLHTKCLWNRKNFLWTD